MKKLLIILSILFIAAAGFTEGDVSKEDGKSEQIDLAYYENLIPLHEGKFPPGPNDWMMHHREAGQSIFQYIKSKPIRPDPMRKYIYIVLLGEFDDTYKEIVASTGKFMEAYFQLEVKFLDPLALSLIPDDARREHPFTKDKQILSTYVMEEVLMPRLPEDAFSLIAFTTSDLWPGEGWNFVFGQASIEDRVGVWSMYRNGNPHKNKEDYAVCLLRTIKTGTHEMGHMFSIPHCPHYECNMNGSNHRQESDRRPLWLCPVDLAKLSWNLTGDPQKRYEDLIRVSKEFLLNHEADFFKRSMDSHPQRTVR